MYYKIYVAVMIIYQLKKPAVIKRVATRTAIAIIKGVFCLKGNFFKDEV
ncbi:MAG: hypothetical protein NTX24_02705 [Candidatus Pacearchaeota archaeon]|nr:hypothetical protein [Candidatus Pacearchaeota archaeon]